jgi:hypothetical protein
MALSEEAVPSLPGSSRDGWQPHDGLGSLEAKMIEAARTADLVEPEQDAADSASVTIRASVLCHLLTDKTRPVAAKGVRLRGVRITGQLDLEGATVPCPLRLENCYLDGDEPVNLDFADVSMLSFTDCKLPGLSAKTLKASKDFVLARSTLTGPLRLLCADITGDLDCSGTRLEGTDDALCAATIKVSGNVYLTDVTTTVGGIDLEGADIGGTLKCTGAQLNGMVRRYGGSYALFAQWAKVRGPVRMNSERPNVRFTAAYTVLLLGADITANLNCRDAVLNGSGTALEAERMKVGGNILGERMWALAGQITLTCAEIAGNLKCTDALLSCAGCALYGERLTVHGDVFFGVDKMTPTPYGAISLQDAEIGGNLNFSNAMLGGANYALYAERLKVHGDLLFDWTSSPSGDIWLRGANINGKLRWAPAEQMKGRVNLSDAKAGQLEDNWTHANGFWPIDGRLNLDGFSYGSFSGDNPANLRQRLGWIRSQWPQDPEPGTESGTARFATQPYEQLASVYQQAGQDSEARAVVLSRRRDMRRQLTGYRKALNWLLDWSIQYGYQTWRAVVALAAVYIGAVAVFTLAQHHGNLIVPLMETSAGQHAPPATQCGSTYPCFYPAGYAIDTVVPIINVHQATYWGPNGHAPLGHALTVFTWVCTAAGWALATLTVAGYTGLVRNNDSL